MTNYYSYIFIKVVFIDKHDGWLLKRGTEFLYANDGLNKKLESVPINIGYQTNFVGKKIFGRSIQS